jgi:hypothetical protein
MTTLLGWTATLVAGVTVTTSPELRWTYTTERERGSGWTFLATLGPATGVLYFLRGRRMSLLPRLTE